MTAMADIPDLSDEALLDLQARIQLELAGRLRATAQARAERERQKHDEEPLTAHEYADEVNCDRGTPARWARDSKVQLDDKRRAARAAWRAVDPLGGKRRDKK